MCMWQWKADHERVAYGLDFVSTHLPQLPTHGVLLRRTAGLIERG